MAAVRRGSESGMVVALVVLVVLAVVGIGGAVWSYRLLMIERNNVRTNQAAFADSIGKQFKDNAWALPTQSPPQLGVSYTDQSYTAVAQKLAEAGEYEKAVKPMLGWESVDGMKAAMAESPAQKEGTGTYATMRALLGYYENAYGQLSTEVGDLRTRNAALTADLDAARKDFVSRVEALNKKVNDDIENINAALTKAQQDYKDMSDREAKGRQDVAGWTQKYQQEAQARHDDVASLQDEAAKWRKQYEDLIAPPEGREQLVAHGKVMGVWPNYEFVMIEGGGKEGVKQNDVQIVYNILPDGAVQVKGVILVGKVNEHTALATITKEDHYIVEGDLFVSQARWDQYRRNIAAAPAGK